MQDTIVDLDGTLLDTLGDLVVALDFALGDLAPPRVGRAFVKHTIGKGSEYLIARTLAQVGGAAALNKGAWPA